MKILRFDSVGGASGDMILGALVGLGVDPRYIERELRRLIPDPFRLKVGEKSEFGATGVYLTVDLDPEATTAENVCEFQREEKCCGKRKPDGSCCGKNKRKREHKHDDEHDHKHAHSHDCEHGHKRDHSHDGDCGHKHDHSHEHEHARKREHKRDHSHDGEHARKREHKHDHSHGDDHAHSHEHAPGRTFASIRQMIAESPLDEKTKRDATAAFEALAVAEAEAHQKPVDEVHFHEVGAVDSLVDTVGCVLALNALGVDGISLSPLPVGEGTFRCAHGVYPLPAPATSILLRNYGLPTSSDNERCEMLTPTAAALFAVWEKKAIPTGARIVATANSFGTRKMQTRPNLLRASIYETDNVVEESEKSPAKSPESKKSSVWEARYNVETLYELATNLDDATGERLATVATALFDLGALDVWTTPILMKKGRPACKLSALVAAEKREAVVDAIFRTSGTFGVRETTVRRRSLARRWETVETSFGPIRVKVGATLDGETTVAAPEFADVDEAARKAGVPFERVYREATSRCDF